MKICKTCGQLTLFVDFYKRYSECKECARKRAKDRYDSIEGQKRIKEYEYKRARNTIRKEKHKIYDAKWKEKNLEKRKATQKAYKIKCKKLGIGEFSKEGKKRTKQLANKRHKKRYEEDTNYKLAINLRSRFYMAIKYDQKIGSAVKDLGCSIEEFKQYLEKQFIENMNWENWGKWHIDHIKPLSSFDLSDRQEVLKATHFSNLQPLWKIDNLKKGSRF